MAEYVQAPERKTVSTDNRNNGYSKTSTNDKAKPKHAADAAQIRFYSKAKMEKIPLAITLMEGKVIEGCVLYFDYYCLNVESNGKEYLIYKHCIKHVTAK